MCASEVVKKDNVGAILDRAMDAGRGILRLAPAWVPRSFLHPGKRIKLAPTDWYALGTHRGGIDERWFASTTEAANEGRSWDEGLSWCTFQGKKFLLKDAVEEGQGRIVGQAIWNQGNNGILDLSKAYRLKPGSGWMIPAGVLHAPGSMCTYEPQWGSDVFGMFQSLVEGREVPWDLLVKDVPKEKHQDLDFIVDQLDWEKNIDPHFKM